MGLKAVSSGAASTPIGSSLTNAGGVLNTTQPTNAQTGTTYTIQTTDAGTLITFNSATAVAVTLPQATTTGYTAGFSFEVQNIGAGAVTITPTTSTIGGNATLVLNKGEGAQVTSDGANYPVSLSTAGKTITSGTFANRPISPVADQLYHATDINIIIVYDSVNTKWKPLGGVGVIYMSGVQTALHTGDTTETNVLIVNIPANLVSANGGLRITEQMVKTGANATCTWQTYLSATSGGTNGTSIHSTISSAATKLSESGIITIWNRNSQSSQVSLSNTNLGVGESTATSGTAAINMANASFLNFTAKPGNAADAVGYDAITVEWLEA